MQVLQICHSYYPPFLDCARQYAALFHGSEHQVVTVYLTGTEDADIARLSASDHVIFLGFKSSQVRGLKLAAITKIRTIIRQHDFAFCIAHRVKPTYVALLASKLPIVSIHHNYNDYTRASRRWFVDLFKKRLVMLGVSDSVRDDLRRDLKNWPAKRIQTLYNRIDVSAVKSELLDKADARQKLGLPENAWVIGNVGRLHHDKDQVTLIKAFNEAYRALPPNSLLVIMGKGPLEAELKKLARNLSIEEQVIFTGNIPNARQYFNAFDIFALTSDREPFGMVLLEAMAAELPIICSDCGGGAEVVRGVAELFPFGDIDSLTKCLIRLSGSKHLQFRSKSLRKVVESFSDEAARKTFWEIIKKAKFIKI